MLRLPAVELLVLPVHERIHQLLQETHSKKKNQPLKDVSASNHSSQCSITAALHHSP